MANETRQEADKRFRETRKALLNQRITSIAFFDFDNGRGGFTSDPAIVLDDQTIVTFSVDETEQGEYGITIKTVRH